MPSDFPNSSPPSDAGKKRFLISFLSSSSPSFSKRVGRKNENENKNKNEKEVRRKKRQKKKEKKKKEKKKKPGYLVILKPYFVVGKRNYKKEET